MSSSMTSRMPLHEKNAYLATAPDGQQIEIPREFFVVLNDFLLERKHAGSMVVHFRNGGIAGLEAVIKKKFK